MPNMVASSEAALEGSGGLGGGREGPGIKVKVEVDGLIDTTVCGNIALGAC